MRDRVFGGCRVSSPSVPCLAGERNAREGQRRRAEVFSQRDREKEQGRNKFSWDRRNRDGECSSINSHVRRIVWGRGYQGHVHFVVILQ